MGYLDGLDRNHALCCDCGWKGRVYMCDGTPLEGWSCVATATPSDCPYTLSPLEEFCLRWFRKPYERLPAVCPEKLAKVLAGPEPLNFLISINQFGSLWGEARDAFPELAPPAQDEDGDADPFVETLLAARLRLAGLGLIRGRHYIPGRTGYAVPPNGTSMPVGSRVMLYASDTGIRDADGTVLYYDFICEAA